MDYRSLADTEIQVSAVCFGTWTIGGADWGRTDDRDSAKAIARAFDLGITTFDTAPIYGSGHAEEILGTTLREVRDQVVIATKCGPWEDELGRLRLDLSRKGVFSQCEASLKRLRTDRIDLLQVHWNDQSWPVADTMETLKLLKESGKIRAFGVSNFSLAELRQALSGGAISLQSQYGLLSTDIERDCLAECARAGAGFLAYEPLGRGLLAGRYTATTRFQDGDIRNTDARFKGAAFKRNLERVARLKVVAESLGISPAQAAIAWVLHNPAVTTAICGIRTAAQAVADAGAADIRLDDSTARKLRAIFGG